MIVGAKVAKKIRIMRNLFLIIFKLHHYEIKNQHFIHRIPGKCYGNIVGDILLNYLKV
jgi:hypothetical protein